MKIRSIHRWVGISICIPVLIMSLTGVLLVWKKEYLWLSIPEAREILITDTTAVSKAVQKIEHSYASDKVLSIQIHAEDLSLYKVILKNRNYAWHDQFGEQIQQWSSNQRWEDWLLDLHHRFLLGNTIGLNIAGISALLLIPLLFIGLIVWWPRRKSFNWALWPESKTRGSLMRCHNNIGASFSAAVVLIAVTGVILVYPVESRRVLVTPFLDSRVLDASPLPASKPDTLNGPEQASWLQIMNRTEALYPGARLRWVWPASSTYQTRTLGLQQSRGWNSLGQTYLSVDLSTGEMLSNHNALVQPISERITNFTHPLHTGKLGLYYKLLLTGFGIALFFIGLFGLGSFIRSFSRR